jgi:crotonobetainyl-CoA:carnitine CoA-transferase CaiB-like acyl-CoA transferase
MTDQRAPLQGIRVLDFSHAASGPLATMYLADLGADIIKVERPVIGDSSRQMGIPMFGPSDTDYEMAMNRSKRSIVIDIATAGGKALVHRLARECDIAVQNYRRGVATTLGIDFESLRHDRTGLVYCSISGFGDSGPLGGRPANDIIMQSSSGLMGVTGERGGDPIRMGAPIADFSTGLHALIGILAALYARADHPEGQHVKVTMLESALAMMANYIPRVATLGHTVPRLGRAHAQIVPYDAFRCGDGKLLMVGAFSEQFWRDLCGIVGHPEWIEDELYSTNAQRLANREQLTKELNAAFATDTHEAWQARLDAAGIPNSTLMELHEVVGGAQVEHLQSLLHMTSEAGEVDVVDFPPRSTAWPRRKPRWPSTLGQDTSDVLADVLGMTTAEIDELREAKVVA